MKEENITVRYNQDGSCVYQVRVRSYKGQKTKSFNAKDFPSPTIALETAKKWRDRARYELDNSDELARSNVTVEEIFERYLDESSLSYKTKEYHTDLFRKYVSTKEKKVQELTKQDIVCDLNNATTIASNDTIARIFAVYKTDIVGQALYEDILLRDITLGIRKPRSRVTVQHKEVTTDRETVLKVEELLYHRMKDKYNAQIVVYLMEVLYYTGMRPAEAEVLTRKDIRNGYIMINKELGSNMDETNVVRECKTPTSVRSVPIHPQLQPVIDELLDFARTDNLFAKSDGTYMNSNWIGTKINYICKENGMEFNLYRMRHNAATSLVSQNVDSRTTMEILGHAHYDMSLYYARSNDEAKEEAVALIS